MTIHHAIVKQAAGRGINFSYPDEDTIEAKHEGSGMVVRVATEDHDGQNEAARFAWDIAQQIADYNSDPVNGDTKITQDLEDLDFVATHDDVELARDPSFEDLLVSIPEALAELGGGEDDEAGIEEEDEDRGSVVPAEYKRRYAEAGHATHCGDWLAEVLNLFCRVTDAETGKEITDLDALETIANANDVSPARYGKLGIATNGWQGRWRMTVRNMLTPRVASKGFILIPDGVGDEGDQEIEAPAEWRAAHEPKAKPTKSPGGVQSAPGEGKKSAKTLAKEAGERGVAAATQAIRDAAAKQ